MMLLTLAFFSADPGQQAASDSGPLELVAQAREHGEAVDARVLRHA